MNKPIFTFAESIIGGFFALSTLYVYHDYRDRRMMWKIYEIENSPGDMFEIQRLRQLEQDMIEYHDLCRKYPLFKVLIGPPEVNFMLLPQKVKTKQ